MKLPDSFYQSLPDAKQRLLIKACVADRDDAIAAWQTWIKVNGYETFRHQKSDRILPQIFDRLDFGSQRLLCLLYKRMTMLNVQHELLTELKGYYRYVWVRNQILSTELNKIEVEF